MNISDELLVKRLLSDHLSFVRYFFYHMTGHKFIVNHHHITLCDIADKIYQGYNIRDIINAPPRYSKTEIFVVMFIAHGFALNPTCNFIHISAMDKLVMENSEKIRDIVCSAEYQRLFPYVQFKSDSNNKGRWKTDRGGGLLAVAAGGQITGFGAGKTEITDYTGMSDFERVLNFNGAIVMDDTIKPDDANSVLKKDIINYRYDSTVKNRVNSRQTPIINMQQRVDILDMSGYLLENDTDTWNVHVMAAISLNEQGKEVALWELKHLLEELYKLRQANPTVFERQYMQDPQPLEGLIFGKADLKTYTRLPDKELWELIIMYSDPADEGNDYHSAPIGIVCNKMVYIVDPIFTKDNLTDVQPQLKQNIKHWKIDMLVVETNSAGALFVRDLREQIDIDILGINNSTNKIGRMLAQEGFVKKHFLFQKEYDINSPYAKFMKQIHNILRNGKEKADDGPDSISGMAFILRKMYQYMFDNEESEE
jgi:predicted phage terminase large subunit-like protein